MSATVDPIAVPTAPSVAEAFRTAMSLLAGGVTIVTAGEGDGRRGLTATAVCSLSMNPPSILACVNCFGEAHAAIEQSRSFCINILAEDDTGISDTFAGKGAETGARKFQDGLWMTLATGAPVLSTALVAVDCDLDSEVRLATHTIFLGHVRGVHVGERRAPLLHFDRRYRSVA